MTADEGTFEEMDEVVEGFYVAAESFIDKASVKHVALEPEGNSWKLCLIAGCAMRDGRCFNCGAVAPAQG